MTNELRGWILRVRLRSATTALAVLASFGLGVAAIPSAKAQSLIVLYSFTGGPDGGNPYADLIRDKAGNLYVTTAGGGVGTCSFFYSGCGTVFKLVP